MKLTPGMKQYMTIKAQHPEKILLFRMGDFYETFYDDAKTLAKVLDITLTARGKGETKAPLAGIPYHALDRYLGQLIHAGYTVALCEQLEDPKQAKGLVKRGVTRIVTPGTVVDGQFLDAKTANNLLALFVDEHVGYAYVDISTGKLTTGETTAEHVSKLIAQVRPAEIVCNENNYGTQTPTKVLPMHAFVVHEFPKNITESARKSLQQKEYAQCALGGLLYFLKENKQSTDHITTITLDKPHDHLILDDVSIENLELLTSKQKSFSLLKTLDTTKTAMGGRTLKEWMLQPLQNILDIRARFGAVQELTEEAIYRDIQEHFSEVEDIPRLCAKITNELINPKELKALAKSLDVIEYIESLHFSSPLLQKQSSFPNIDHVKKNIHDTLADEPTVSVREGNFIKKGFNEELDTLRELATNSKGVLAKIQKREQEKTNIPTLKVRYNKVFGYFIEVTSRFSDQVPDYYQRKQTLVNAERFVTDELKELEHKIITAQEKSHAIEYNIFCDLLENIYADLDKLQTIAEKIATIDVLSCFAENFVEYDYCIPEFTEQNKVELHECRHPVVERNVEQFIPNTCILDKDNHMHIITGPNMAGKSTYMRQIALCALLAHMGCPVPAKKASMGIIDRIFTRIGARDDLTQGQSTFMVEMQETATILNNATERSLVILDEIGRGTSTYDGVALAYAVAEDLRTNTKAKTLFATHYHVLTSIGDKQGGANFNVSVKQHENTIVFLHKVVAGGTDKSYGIHVAELAGVPLRVIREAQNMQMKLMSSDNLAQKISVTKRIEPIQKKENNTVVQETVIFEQTLQKTLLDDE